MRRTILTLVLLGVTTPAIAQTPPPMPGGPMRGGMLMRADANGDGTITRAEAIAAADMRFDRLDTNHDGTATLEEMRTARDAMRAARAGDGDGSPPPADRARRSPPPGAEFAITREQSRARVLEAFTRADTNGDGTVDQAERTTLRPPRGGPQGGGDRPLPPPGD